MTKTWLTMREAADYVRVSEGLIRKAVQLGYLTAYTFGTGKSLRFTTDDLDEWMMSRAWEPPGRPKRLDL